MGVRQGDKNKFFPMSVHGRIKARLRLSLLDLVATNDALREIIARQPGLPNTATDETPKKRETKRMPKDVGKISQTFVVPKADIDQVTMQLGYSPTNLIEVSARSAQGIPTVVKVMCYPSLTAFNPGCVRVAISFEDGRT
jgi:hypothetical protein